VADGAGSGSSGTSISAPSRAGVGPTRVGPAPARRPRSAAPARGAGVRVPADDRPVARVVVDVPLAHLDRPFDYLVPAGLDGSVEAGCRVRVRFSGRLVDGYVLDRLSSSAHTGNLAFLDKVVSPEPVLRPEVAELARAVADRYAGGLADVLRLAIPPRHARAENAARPAETPPSAAPPAEARPTATPTNEAPTEALPTSADEAPSIETAGGAEGGGAEGDGTGWGAYPAGPAFVGALAAGQSPRTVWTVLPGEDWPARFAEAVAATVHSGRGAVVVVPDARDLDRLDAAIATVLGPDRYVSLAASLGPAERYRRFLRASRRAVPVVLGTRAAALAPMADLGLVAIWDDGDDLHAEPRSPYPHALQVLLIRAQLAGAGALVAASARSTEAQLLIETRWAQDVSAARDAVRRRAPSVVPTGDDLDRARDPAAATARLPSVAWRAARDALAAGAPVLVQVPRRGYLPSVSCVDCHTPARCARCAGPLELRSSHAVAACRWCGRPAADFACHRCGGRRLRAAVIGAGRTAEELGRAFPGVPVRTSGRDGVLSTVGGEPAVVVATPGAEPAATGGYGAVLLLDTWALLTRADLRAGEEALRRWMAAASLARPGEHGGRVVVVADGGLITVQALLRWDPATFAGRELAERRELGFPPAARLASLTGPADAVADLVALAELPEGTELLGPVPVGEDERILVRAASRTAGAALAGALHAAAGVRSARKAEGAVRIQVDPRELW
jgi:primosomal protein N' (replication factor Y)